MTEVRQTVNFMAKQYLIHVCLKVTYADLALFDFFDNFSDYIQLEVFLLMSKEKAPKLSALWQKVRDLPTVATYADSRPYDYDEP